MTRGDRTRHREGHVGRYARAPAWALVVLVIMLALISYFPFDWSPPRTVTNDVARLPGGSLVFGEQNAARSSASPRWLESAQTSQELRITLEVRPKFPQKHDPVSIMMFAQDYWHTNFAIGQNDTSLVLWLRP